MVPSIKLGQKFKSYEELSNAILNYSQNDQKVPYVVYSSKSAKWFNAKQANADDRMDEKLVWKEAMITCKHYGKPREHQHIPGKKERPNQGTFKKFCKAKFNINYKVDEGCFIVTKLNEVHENHLMEDHLKNNYPEFRAAPQNALNEAEDLLNIEVKAQHIRQMVCNHGIKATRQDIQNIRNKWKAKLKGCNTSEDAVFEQLDKLLEEDPNSVAVVKYDETTFEIQSIFFQTSSMRESFTNFPELLVMDTTYKLCTNDMPLIVFEVVDCFGSGRIAGYALISSERKEIVTHSLNVMNIGCAEAMSKVSVVMIDRDQSEIAAVKDILPHADVHLCDYHVKDAIKISGHKYQSRDYDKVVHPIVCKVIHAHTKKEYDSAYEELQKVANKDFMGYFNKRWHETDLVWSDYQRNLSYNLGERTTGRVESHNAKIKKLVSSRAPVAEVILRLRLMNSFLNMDSDYKRFVCAAKTMYNKYSKDPIIQLIRNANTPFIADALERQYQRSLEPPSHNLHLVSINSCDCKFFSNTKLPCAHIFRERQSLGEVVYDHTMIPQRWTLSLIFNTQTSDNANPEIVVLDSKSVKAPKRPKALSSEEKYRECMKKCTNICSLVSITGGQHYKSCIDALCSMKKLLQEGKAFAVVGLDANFRPEGTCFSSAEATNHQHEADKGQEPSNDSDVVEVIHSSNAKSPNNNLESNHGSEIHEDDTPGAPNNGTAKLSYRMLDQQVKKKLKLPVAVPTKGCPKGNKRPKQMKKKKITAAEPNIDSDEDGNLQIVHSSDNKEQKCDICNGPALQRTSFSKKNRGRKYITCCHPKTDSCKSFHAWVKEDAASTAETLTQIVDTGGIIVAEDVVQNVDSIVENANLNADPEFSDDSVTFIDEIPTSLNVVKVERNEREEGFTDISDSFWKNDGFDDTLGLLPLGNSDSESVIFPCVICEVSGKPDENGAHKCAVCSVPVHAFGCSVPFNNGGEGCGGNDRMCIPCSLKGNCEKSAAPVPKHQAVKVSSGKTGSTSLASGTTFQPTEEYPHQDCEEYKCFQCGTPTTRRIKTSPGKSDRAYHICTKCDKFLFWASKSSIVPKSPLPSSCSGEKGDKDGLVSFSQPKLDSFLHKRSRNVPAPANVSDTPDENEPAPPIKKPRRNIVPVQEMEDDEICDALQLLSQQFPDVGGWTPPAAGVLSYDVAKAHEDTVHIIYDRERAHWITLIILSTSKASTSRSVFIYDTLQRSNGVPNLTDSVKSAVAQMCNEKGPAISVNYAVCQQQSDTVSCGYLAVAYALDFCLSRKIRFRYFKMQELVNHFRQCLIKKTFTSFPIDPTQFKSPGKVKVKEVIEVFCDCRMPQEYDFKTIECDRCMEWFHFKCVGLKASPGNWFCKSCRT